ncbi:MAG: hypothetical protein ACOZNI_36295 [Myxococcota bacterium]
MTFLVPFALAQASPEAFPLRLDVALPERGPGRVELPADVVGAAPHLLDRTLLLVGAGGAGVPYTVVRSGPDVAWSEGTLSFRPAGEHTWAVEGPDVPIDELVLLVEDLDDLGPVRAEVRWGTEGRATALLYELDAELRNDTIPLPGVGGPFLLTLTPLRDTTADLDLVRARTRPPELVPPVRERLAVGPPAITEHGTARWVVPLPGPRTVTAIELESPEPRFDREVRVGHPGVGASEPSLEGWGRVRRLDVGAVKVERTRVAGLSVADDTLVFEIATDRGRPMEVTGVVVESVGAWLLANDAGAGPHVLYAGTTEPLEPYDLGMAAPALLRVAPPPSVAGPPSPNPAFLPRATREGVDAPGPLVNFARFRWTRPIEGPPGWARLRLDADVLAHARPDLADLRVVDAAGAQIPYVTRATGWEAPLELGAMERTEDGSTSLLRVPLPRPDVPVATVRLATGADLFERTVEILRDRGRMTETLRYVQWRGSEQGGALAIAVNDRLGGDLLIRVQNGDNAPLPVTAVEATTAVWELRARIPEGGARLLYGAPGEHAPDYDLALLREEVLRTPVPEAKLGPEAATGTPELATRDRLLVIAGVVALALGLVGMTVRVLAGVQPSEPDPKPEA